MSMEEESGTLDGVGGLELHWQCWRPDGAPRAVVVLAHGASEHSGRYAWTGGQLAERGYALYALDHRGHGRSQGPRALIDRLDHAVNDLDGLVDLASARWPDAPTFLLGHSMGGAIALAYALRHQDKLDGLLLSAPLAHLEAAPAPTRIAGRVLSVIAPKLGVFAIDPTAVSRDPEVVREYERDPLNHHGKLPARTVAELSSAIARFPDDVSRLELPILTMHGSADRLTPPEGSEMVVTRAGSQDKTILRYDGLYHELLQEPERARILGDIVTWLEKHPRRERQAVA